MKFTNDCKHLISVSGDRWEIVLQLLLLLFSIHNEFNGEHGRTAGVEEHPNLKKKKKEKSSFSRSIAGGNERGNVFADHFLNSQAGIKR